MMLSNSIKFLLPICIIVFLSGCTHKIDITPNSENIINDKYEINKKNYNIGYIIDNIDLEIVSAGGGGDKISYFPYKETESAFRTILVKHFNKVYLVNNNDRKFILDNNIKLVFNYKITTYSSSESVFTWPPTKFVITLDCKAINNDGNLKWEKVIIGEGNASFNEFKNDFSLAGKRATENLFKKLLIELNTKELNEENQ